MVNPQISSYITEQRNAGVSDEAIQAELLASGWQHSQVDEAFLLQNSTDQFVSPTPLSPLSPVSNQAASFKKYKKLVYGLMIFVLLVALGGLGVFAYLSNNPEKVVQKMTERFVSVKTMEYSGKMIVTANKNYPSELDSA